MILESLSQRGSKFVWVLLAVVLLCCGPLRAQQESSSAQKTIQGLPGEETGPSTPDNSTGSFDSSTLPIPAAVAAESAPIRSIGSASLLDSTSNLRWGNFSIGVTSYEQAFENLSPRTGIGATKNVVSLFSTQIVYDKEFRTSRFALQYKPRAMIFDGNLVSNLLNQDLQFDTVFILSPRLTLNVGDVFTYQKNRDTFGESLLDVNTITATTLQKDFLTGSGTFLAETLSPAFNYLMSARTKLSIVPSFTYTSTSLSGANNPTGPTETFSSRAYSLRTNVSHDLSARTSIGAYHQVQLLTSTSNTFARTIYQDFGGSVSQMIGTSWHVGGSFGAATASFSTGRQWTESISANVLKDFQKWYGAVSYSRGQVLTGFVTNHFGDRVDLTVRTRWVHRFQLGVGSGYERDITGTDRIWGKYANGQVSYQLTRSLSGVAGWVRKWQYGNDAQLYSGTANLFSFGLSWDPRPKAQ
jgi:hypothetical protein